jgi:hypothetical protein
MTGVCLLLLYLLESCSRGGRGIVVWTVAYAMFEQSLALRDDRSTQCLNQASYQSTEPHTKPITPGAQCLPSTAPWVPL